MPQQVGVVNTNRGSRHSLDAVRAPFGPYPQSIAAASERCVILAAARAVMLKLLRINNIALIPALELELGPGLTLLTGETGAGKSILIDALGLLLGRPRLGRPHPHAAKTAPSSRASSRAPTPTPFLERARPARGGRRDHPAPRDPGRGKGPRHGQRRARARVGAARAGPAPRAHPRPARAAGPARPGDAPRPARPPRRPRRRCGARGAACYRALRDGGDRARGPAPRPPGGRAPARDARVPGRGDREGRTSSAGRGGGAAPGEGRPGQRRTAWPRCRRRPTRCSTKTRRRCRPGWGRSTARSRSWRRSTRGSRRYLEVAQRASWRSSTTWRCSCATTARRSTSARAAGRDRDAAGPDRAAQAEVRRDRRGGPGVRTALPGGAAGLGFAGGARGASWRRKGAPRRASTSPRRGRSRASAAPRRRTWRRRSRRAGVSSRWRRPASRSASIPTSRRSTADDPSSWTERGLESAEFLLSPNPGEELRPLAKIASGGELSRILLALKSVASLDDAGQDARLRRGRRGHRRGSGGGRGPQAQGHRRAPSGPLRHAPAADRLAGRPPLRRAQARGARADGDRGAALLDADERIEEVARMLGGETVTETARRHAREMVKQGRERHDQQRSAKAASSSRRSAAR